MITWANYIANYIPVPGGASRAADVTRRRALAAILGASRWLPAAPAVADDRAPLRFGISESMVGDVNLNDARAAMSIWIQRIGKELNIAIEPKILNTTQEIVDRTRKGQVDAVAVNVIEYRPIADLLDSRQVVTAAGVAGLVQYVILAKRNSGIRNLSDLKGRRLCRLTTPKMCVAPAWLFTLLEEGHHGPAERFFGPVVMDGKFSRVVLPVFFGQADACLTTKKGFDTMCELNPQVGKDLTVIASSPAMVVEFYIFRKNYLSVNREKLIMALLGMRASPAGGQLAALFQFEGMEVRDLRCLASALGVLDAADRAGSRPGGGQKA